MVALGRTHIRPTLMVARQLRQFLPHTVAIIEVDCGKLVGVILNRCILRNDFSACVNLFQDFIDQDANQETKTVTIAAVRTSDDGDVQPDMSVEDRYYNHKEYAKLTSAQKLGLKAKRDKQGHKSKRKRGTSSDGKIDLSKKTIKALASAVTNKVRFEDGEDADSEPSGNEAASSKRQKKTTNRNNPALSRPNQE